MPASKMKAFAFEQTRSTSTFNAGSTSLISSRHFDKIAPRNAHQYSAELKALVPSRQIPSSQRRIQRIKFRQRSDLILSKMAENNIKLSTADYANLLASYGMHRDYGRMHSMWLEYRASDLQLNTEVYNAYLFALCGHNTRKQRYKSGAKAKRLIQLIEEIEVDYDVRAAPNDRTYMLLITLYRNARYTPAVLDILESKFGITKEHLMGSHPLSEDTLYPVNTAVLNTALSALGHLNMLGAMTNLFLNMKGHLAPTIISHQTVSRHLLQYYKPKPKDAPDPYGEGQVETMAEYAGSDNVYKLILPSKDLRPTRLISQLPEVDERVFNPWIKLAIVQKKWGTAKELMQMMLDDCGVEAPLALQERVYKQIEKMQDQMREKANRRIQSAEEPIAETQSSDVAKPSSPVLLSGQSQQATVERERSHQDIPISLVPA